MAAHLFAALMKAVRKARTSGDTDKTFCTV
jgi:hypothetical protein